MPITEKVPFKTKIKENKNGDIYINWMAGNWLVNFIDYHFPNRKGNLIFISVDGMKTDLSVIKGKKIFFSGENLEPVINHKNIKNDYLNFRYYWFNFRKNIYKDYLINEVNVSIGCGKKNSENYLRFPLWLMYLFSYSSNYNDIKVKISEINNMKNKGLKECVCINRHDLFGVRTKICGDVKDTINITYAGKWRNNTDELWNRYNDDKCKYMNLFKFNICPENMDAADYCTEKIFDALRCGCIPIYAGCLNNPEPEIINKDFVILWDLDGDNTEQLKLVKRLNTDNEFYKKFVNQPKLKPDAADYIAEYFENLKQKLRELI